jgi:hypothetical protein
MKSKHRLLTFALLASAAALLVIIVCAHQFRWGRYFPVKNVTPKEMVGLLKTSNVYLVSTPEPDEIWLETKLGFRYHTVWKPIPGTDYEDISGAWSLAEQILLKERGLDLYSYYGGEFWSKTSQ